MRRLLPLLIVMGGLSPRLGEAGDLGTYRFDPGGTVRDVRVVDMDGDGRPDLVILIDNPDTGIDEIVIARTPAKPTRSTFFSADAVTRIPCTGALATCGAVAVGRFGPKGVGRLRFLGPDGVVQIRADGTVETPGAGPPVRTLLARSPGRDLIFWDGVGDLDADGLDELWVPLAEGDGPMRVLAGDSARDRTLSITANNIGASTDALLLSRHAYVPNLFPADLDGDGTQELVALQGEDLVAWDFHPRGTDADSAAPQAPSYRLHLPFLEEDPERPSTQMHVPRIQLRDVDQDGTTDLLVTLLTGEHGKLQSLRTSLFHFPGPFRDEKSGALVKPRARIDTKSCVLHPLFVDLDQDGALDYVGDSMHGSQTELFARMLGKEPRMTFVGFRFDRAQGTFEATPYFTAERPYASSETLSNRFGRSAWFAGDFDGDGHADLLDLGNLKGAEILRGTPEAAGGGRVLSFVPGLLRRVPVEEGLRADARLADLDADGRTDAILWSTKALYLVVPRGAR